MGVGLRFQHRRRVLRKNHRSQPKERTHLDAIRFGVVENVVLNEARQADYCDTSLTENGRCCYPLYHVEKRSATNGWGPKCVIFLTATSQAYCHSSLYQRSSSLPLPVGLHQCGSTELVQKRASTQQHLFGAPFIRPAKIMPNLLMKRIEDFGSQVYLINTGWTGGSGGANGAIASQFLLPERS